MATMVNRDVWVVLETSIHKARVIAQRFSPDELDVALPSGRPITIPSYKAKITPREAIEAARDYATALLESAERLEILSS